MRVGSVDYVAPDEIKGTLDIESPDSVALNAGHPRPFPRVNSYLLIQVDDAFLVGQAEWITIERSPFPKRRGMQDFGIVDLPYPLRRIKLNPLGMLRKTYEGEHEEELESKYDFQRGSEALPSVGATIFLPTERQLRAIIESGKNRRVKMGTSPLAGDAEIYVDPDRLFGRHLAVLGNTGSGKSCSVAGLIRWSLNAAKNELDGEHPNARFIILDPNGEYSRAFKGDDTINARVFKVDPGEGDDELKVPLWLWNSMEWVAFTRASSGVQRPVLMRALRTVRGDQDKSGAKSSADPFKYLKEFVQALETCHPKMDKGEARYFRERLIKWKRFFVEQKNQELEQINEKIEAVYSSLDTYSAPAFLLSEVGELIEMTKQTYSDLGGVDFNSSHAYVEIDVDAPGYFRGEALIEAIRTAGIALGVSENIDTLGIRTETLLRGSRIKPIIDDESEENLNDWLKKYIGDDDVKGGSVSIIDLSLVPTEIIHIITAVIARIIFEALQRYMKLKTATLPTVLVMEEAHTFVKHYKRDAEDYDAAKLCCQVFERIAREGRKFGLGLVISSQRPSEISPTVLSQCNTFLLHRISNDRDQEHVQKLVPDNLRGLLRELPLLPSQRAILLGWASELPVLMKMRDLPPEHQPQSDDPDIWKVWTRKEERKDSWDEVANQWLNITPPNQTNQGNKPSAQQKSEGQK